MARFGLRCNPNHCTDCHLDKHRFGSPEPEHEHRHRLMSGWRLADRIEYELDLYRIRFRLRSVLHLRFGHRHGGESSAFMLNLHAAFLPYGCYDSTNGVARSFCILYSAQTVSNADNIYMAWATTIDGVYTPIGCAGPGMCTTATPVTVLTGPPGDDSNYGLVSVVNVGGSTGTNYIYAIEGGAETGTEIDVLTTPANSSTTTSGNTLTFVKNIGMTAVSGVDWYAPNSSSRFEDPFVFLDHCGLYELYYTIFNNTSPGAPFTNGANQIVGEGVSNSPTGPFYLYNQAIIPTNSSLYGGTIYFGDSAAIELNNTFIYSGNYDDSTSKSRAVAAIGPEGNCP